MLGGLISEEHWALLAEVVKAVLDGDIVHGYVFWYM